ncbi:aminopeptidase N [Kangiella sp. HZ709]|uniref:aminopeptidase N n=1 Tax=Kangiella sp. HZ709 TaxID=2666328 RepID=UPI0012AF8E46|nr:aminopeptidase N [Kangiella sp. HZ709]MRX26741.1 aminopeptidase N [Kangiella sp. HZ709]
MSELVKYRKDYQVSNFLITDVRLIVQLFDGYALVKSNLGLAKNPNLSTVGAFDTTLKLDGVDLELVSIELDGQKLVSERYHQTNEHLFVYDCPESFQLTTQVKIYPEKNTSLEGLYQSSDKYCTQCEAEGFRKITFYLDRPDVMASFEVRIEADKNQYPYLLSNGNNVDSGDLDIERHYAVWRDPHKKPSYLFALCAGKYDLLESEFITQSGRKVLLQIFVDEGKLEQCHHAMESLKKSMRWDEQVFGLEYDLDIYMIVAVGDFNMGAMENKGLNVFNTKYVLASQATATDQDFEDVEAVIAHEYFHNWTGNRVTCRDWFQLSLKEGLTVFRDQQFTADQTDAAVKRIEDVKVIRAHQFAEDAGPMAHPIRPDSYIEMNNFYTVTVYNKGAEVIRMYHTLLGADGFRKGMDVYFKRHDGQAVTCEDFVLAMEDANDYSFKQFRNWYSQAGTPMVKANSVYDAVKKEFTLNLSQTTQATPGQEHKTPFHIPIKMGLLSEEGVDMALQLITEEHLQDDILHFTKKEQSFTFKNVISKPIVSLLRNFSAPIKLEYDYSNKELSFLLANDRDAFNRWEAGQRLYTNVIWQLYDDSVSGSELKLPETLISVVRKVLNNDDLEHRFKALALTIPDVKTLIESRDSLQFDHLLQAHDYLSKQMAINLEHDWYQHYLQSAPGKDFSQTKESVGQRALKAKCLDYLLKLQKKEYFDLATKQLSEANNMTDAISAFKLLMHSSYVKKDLIAESFYQRWKSEDLVIDKWLTVLATDPSDACISMVKGLQTHEAFEITNPNKVRALIGGFSNANMRQFHRPDGLGYQFLTQQIISLYAVNPQIAARLTGAFNRWKKFDEERQKLMKQQLEAILSQPKLSKDVYEIASKALK